LTDNNKPKQNVEHDMTNNAEVLAGDAVGTIGGAAAGAAVGSIFLGPLGMIAGAVAGAALGNTLGDDGDTDRDNAGNANHTESEE